MTNVIPVLWEDVIPFQILKQFKPPCTEDILPFQPLFFFSSPPGEKLNPLKNVIKGAAFDQNIHESVWCLTKCNSQSKLDLLTHTALQGVPISMGL